MAGSLNRVTLVGNLGRDPEIRSLQNGGKVATFSVATSETWKDKASGEKREKTDWHNVVVWNEGLVGIVEKYVKKGTKLLVEGKLETRKWEKDGVERYSTEVVLTGFGGQILLLGESGGAGRAGAPSEADKPATALSGAIDDDIPF